MSGLRQRMRSAEPLLGTFLDLGSALAADITAGAGFDWLILDLEHGAGGREATLAQLQAARAPVIVRVPSAESEETGWVLDHGAAGVLVPRAQGIREAARAEAATRYDAARGLDPGSRAAGFGRDAGYGERADEERVVMIQIETRGALDDVDDIAAAPRRRRAVRRPLRPRRRARRDARRRHAGGAGRRPAAWPRRRAARARPPRSSSATRRSLPSTATSASRSSARASRARCLAGASDAILAALRP